MRALFAAALLAACGSKGTPDAAPPTDATKLPPVVVVPDKIPDPVVPVGFEQAWAEIAAAPGEAKTFCPTLSPPPDAKRVWIPPGRLALLKKAERICLERAGLTVFPDEVVQLSALKSLVLYDNRLTEVPAALGNLTQLEHLDLAGNPLRQIPAPVLGLSKLTNLSVRNVGLATVPPELAKLTALTYLDLRENPILVLPGPVAALPKLEQLELSGTALAELPPELGKSGTLSALSLAETKITRLPEGLSELAKLQRLQLRGAPLAPDEIERLFGVMEARPTLELEGLGEAETLEKAQTHPDTVYALTLADAGLTQLPPSVLKMRNLRVLDARGNKWRKLPDGLSALVKLRELRVDQGRLEALPPLGTLTELRVLSVAGNRLAVLPAGLPVSLRELVLAENQLVTLPDELTAMSELRVLDVYGNQLSKLPDGLEKLTKLEVLDVEENKLAALAPAVVALPSLQLLAVGPDVPLPDRKQVDEGRVRTTAVHNGAIDTRTAPVYGQVVFRGSVDRDFPETRYLFGEVEDWPLSEGELPRLRVIALEGAAQVQDERVSQMTELPEWLGSYRELRTLKLERHKLRALPKSLAKLTRLRELELRGNPLGKLPKPIPSLPRLESLGLRGTKLTELPSDIAKVTTLRRLDLGDNPIAKLPPGIFELVALEELLVDDTRIPAADLDALQAAKPDLKIRRK
jgi:Leucine-rich repeat (LRR) protein